MRRSRERWLDEGLEILAESGIGALTIDALATRLGLSKGSFYHHFDGMPGYRQALLEYFEERESRDFIERASASPEPAGEARLRHAIADVMAAEGGRPRLENAVRSWASSDPVAREYLDRIDRARLEFLQEQLEAFHLERQTAADFARMAYLMWIGVTETLPPLAPSDVVRFWDLLLLAAARSAGADR